MKSRLLSKLESKIATANDSERGELLAEHAAYLARSGEVEAAQLEIGNIRQQYLRPADSRLLASLNITEALCHYYKDMGPAAEDRFARARAIALLGGHEDLVARSASWLSLLKYGDYDFEGMVRYIDESVDATAEIHSFVASRSSLSIALTLHLANRFDLSLQWYRRAHLMAVETEDEATISALLHDMASIWASNARNAYLGGPITSDSSRQALNGVISTFNFDELVGLAALSFFTPVLEAQIHSLESRYDLALSLYDTNISKVNLKAVGGWQAWLFADKAWCHLQENGPQGVPDMLEQVESMLNSHQHVDDRAAALRRLGQCWAALGEPVRARALLETSNALWISFQEMQLYMVAIVTSSKGYKKLEGRCPL